MRSCLWHNVVCVSSLHGVRSVLYILCHQPPSVSRNMASLNFEHPLIDWDSLDLYQEFRHFRNHISFVSSGPLADISLGEHGHQIYQTLAWEEGDKEELGKVLDKFQNHVQLRKNKRVARHCSKQRRQRSGKSFDHFIKDLMIILMNCDYRDPDDILVDCIIDGSHDKKVQEKNSSIGERSSHWLKPYELANRLSSRRRK